MVIKPITAILTMAIFIKLAYNFTLKVLYYYKIPYAYQINTFAVIIMAVFVYFSALLLLKEIKYSDLVLIPGIGKKLADFLIKINILDD
jgi:stage V sporulation protein B